jgi:hypothetical protein
MRRSSAIPVWFHIGPSVDVVGDVDTHAATHCVVVIDMNGPRLATAEFPASAVG